MPENVGRRGDSWFFRIDLPPDADGKRRQRRVSGFANERAARRGLAQTKVDIDAGRLRHGPQRTVVDLAAEWLEAVRPNRKASTFSTYGWLMRAYVVPRIGAVRLDRLSPTRIQKLYSDLGKSGGRGGSPLSGTQVRNIHRVLHNALNYAVRLGYIARNPTEAIDTPRDDSQERTVYTPEEVRRFLRAIEGDRLEAMWYLVLSTGCVGPNLPDCDGATWRWIGMHRSWPSGRHGRPLAMRWSSRIRRAGRAGACCTLVPAQLKCSGRIAYAWRAKLSSGVSLLCPNTSSSTSSATHSIRPD